MVLEMMAELAEYVFVFGTLGFIGIGFVIKVIIGA